MTRLEVASAVEQIVAAVAEEHGLVEAKDAVTPRSSLHDDLGMDEVDLIEVVFRAEERFGLVLPDNDIGPSSTVSDIVDLVAGRLREQEAPLALPQVIKAARENARDNMPEVAQAEIGSNAYLAAVTPADLQKFGIGWSLKLTNEGGFIVALVAGLVIANFFPRLADWLKEAIRPELYVKIAIVILGGFLAVNAAGKLNLATSLLWRGTAAIIEAYLIYWAVVYFVARKWSGFTREYAVPLASGISICGVAAAIATGGAIRARPAVRRPTRD